MTEKEQLEVALNFEALKDDIKYQKELADLARGVLKEAYEQIDVAHSNMVLIWKHLCSERIRHDYIDAQNRTLEQVLGEAIGSLAPFISPEQNVIDLPPATRGEASTLG